MVSKTALRDIKVLDFGWGIVGPVTTKYLSDHGATVIRIESAERPDIVRSTGPFMKGKPGVNRSGYYAFFNPNKHSIGVNIKHPQGLDLIKRIVALVDVVAESFSPGVMEKLGLGYKELKAIKSDIIMYRASGLGQFGPYAHTRGLGFQLAGLSGFIPFTGWPDREPVAPFGAYTDLIAPRFGAIAILAALEHRRQTGKGTYIDLSQVESGLLFLAPALLEFVANGRGAQQVSNTCEYAAPHGVYPCKGDDRWCGIAVFSEEEWQVFCQATGNPEWAADPRFSTLNVRKANEPALDELVAAWTRPLTAEEVMTLLQKHDIPSGIVENPKDLWQDSQLGHRQFFWRFKHPEIDPCIALGQSFILSKTPAEPRYAPPTLGEYTAYVCTNLLGMDDQEFIELLNTGVIQ